LLHKADKKTKNCLIVSSKNDLITQKLYIAIGSCFALCKVDGDPSFPSLLSSADTPDLLTYQVVEQE
jgi:hypothetical protein